MATFEKGSISTFTDEVNGPKFAELFLDFPEMDLFTKQTGVAGTQAINLVDSTIVFGGDFCFDTNASSASTVTFTQRNLTVCELALNKSFCPTELRTYWVGQTMNKPNSNEEMPLGSLITDMMAANVEEELSKLFWQGNTSTGSGNLARCNGVIKNLSGATFAGNYTTVTGSSSMAYANIDTTVDAMVALVPAKLMKTSANMVLGLSVANFSSLRRKLIAANLLDPARFVSDDGLDNMEFYHPVYPWLLVKGFGGLEALNHAFIMPKDMTIIAISENMGDYEAFYDKSTDKVIVRMKMLFGAQVARPEYIVVNNFYTQS